MPARSTRCLIGMGANLGDPHAALRAAAERIDAIPGVQVQSISRTIDTTPVGGPPGQPRFANAAATAATTLAPAELLAGLMNVEQAFGRTRRTRWDARTLDLDLLLCGDVAGELEGAVVPHPRMTFRRFVLEPAAEVAGDWVHPLLGQTVGELARLVDHGENRIAVRHAEAGTLDEVRMWAHAVRPAACVAAYQHGEAIARLTVVLADVGPVADAGPTLWLPPGHPPEVRRQELQAAVECVWPGVG